MKLRDNRSSLLVILLSIITFGIYGFILVYQLAEDTNEACASDGKNTLGLLAYIILTILTAGIFSIIWWVLIVDRWNAYLQKNGKGIRITPIGYLLWTTIGSFIIIGPFVALHQSIHTMNDVAATYNHS